MEFALGRVQAVQTSSAGERLSVRGAWPRLFASSIAPERPSCFSSPWICHAPGLGPCCRHWSGAGVLAGGSSVAAGLLGLASLAPAQPFPEEVLELGLPERSPGSDLTLHCVARLSISGVLGSFWPLEIRRTWQEAQGRASSVSPVMPISDEPHPGLASPANGSCSSRPLRCPISITSMGRDSSATFKDSWAAPESGCSDPWACSRWGEGSHPGPQRQQRLGLAWGARTRCGCWVLSVTRASLALTESLALTVKQEHNLQSAF